MSAEDTIRILLMRDANKHGPLDPAEWQRVAARVAWVRRTMAAWEEAERKVEQAWDRTLDSPSPLAGEGRGEGAHNELDDLPPPPEQVGPRNCVRRTEREAQRDAIHAEIRAVIDHDRWPRGLHFKGI